MMMPTDVLHSIIFSSCAVVHDRIVHDIISMPDLLYSNDPVHASEQVPCSELPDNLGGTCELDTTVVEDTAVVMVDDPSHNMTPIHTMGEGDLDRTPSPFHGENAQSSTTSTGLDDSTKSELRHHEVNQGTVLHELFYNGLLGEALQGIKVDEKSGDLVEVYLTSFADCHSFCVVLKS